jgi:membrane protease YdiL (CAAX protease family)
VVYFLTGLAFGSLAYLANSIFPSLIVHVLGDTLFFTLIWPNDVHRSLIAQEIEFSALAVLTFINASRARGSASRRSAVQENL